MSEKNICKGPLEEDISRWPRIRDRMGSRGHRALPRRKESESFPLHLPPLLGLAMCEKVRWVLLSSQAPAWKQS